MESRLTQNIRPMAAACLTLTACAGVLVPGITVPEPMWDVLQWTLGGYVAGRSGEKIFKLITKDGAIPWPLRKRSESSTP